MGAGLVDAFMDRGYNVAANSRNITKRAFEASGKLALVPHRLGRGRETDWEEKS
jgi:hypothetical protein